MEKPVSLTICADHAYIEAIQAAVRSLNHFQTLLVFGTGGSALGARVCLDYASYVGTVAKRARVIESVDVACLGALRPEIEAADTALFFVSKSGETLETLFQFLWVQSLLAGDGGGTGYADRCFVLTENKPSSLRALAVASGMTVFDHHLEIGGRYSVFSNVGMIPAGFVGLDVSEVMRGGAEVLMQSDTLFPTIARALTGKTHLAILTYCEGLTPLLHWFAQLWAESLGKNGKGCSVSAWTGPVFQHSQLQRWMDGPNDTVFLVVRTQATPSDSWRAPVQSAQATPTQQLLSGASSHDLLDALENSTTESLRAAGRDVIDYDFGDLRARNLGRSFAEFMVLVLRVAEHLQVNPFDQPGVEDGKLRAKQKLRDRLK